ncbi:hypothetical protein HME9304_02663 [Flagellimonas maritima]|uniref:Uncharacterized protein n=1 Tax=Flagellimonas maritima TaxID=1383885 RepID=A0A2Z4LUY9_9FLAO|nr:hypothetical protein HME9304_02663 [Allomuricauda aurantiaca]
MEWSDWIKDEVERFASIFNLNLTDSTANGEIESSEK